ncbi:hypothetical protein D3C75_1048610 [compost metagenome]
MSSTPIGFHDQIVDLGVQHPMSRLQAESLDLQLLGIFSAETNGVNAGCTEDKLFTNSFSRRLGLIIGELSVKTVRFRSLSF